MADWKKYNEGKSSAAPRPRLMKTLDQYFDNKVGFALDLGCGSGRDSAELLKRGWRVDALDSDLPTLEAARDFFQNDLKNLSFIHADFSDLSLADEKYDLVNASYSLPFCPPPKFHKMWKEIFQSLKVGGILSCELFGIYDTWNDQSLAPKERSFFTREEVEGLFSPYKLEFLKEEEFDGPTFSLKEKHWLLRKPYVNYISRLPLA